MTPRKDPDKDMDNDTRGGRNPDRATDCSPTTCPPRHHTEAHTPMKPAPMKPPGGKRGY